MNTTHKNHTKMMNFLIDTSYKLDFYADQFNLSKVETYWKLLKEQSLLTMKDIHDFFIDNTNSKFQILNKESSIVEIALFGMKFGMENFNDEIVDGFKFIGDLHCDLRRVAKRIKDKSCVEVFGESYQYDFEQDYDTAIEFVTYKHYKVPAYKCIKIDENTIFIFRNECRDKFYYKKSIEYVGYGILWM